MATQSRTKKSAGRGGSVSTRSGRDISRGNNSAPRAFAKLPPEIRLIQNFAATRRPAPPADRLAATRAAARTFRESLLAGPQCVYYRTFDLVRVPYPVKYGLLNAAKVTTPFMHILNRLFLVQYKTSVGIKTLLFSPSDLEANGETPFFKRLSRSFGPFEGIGKKFIAPILSTVEQCVRAAGMDPAQVDYISYDHLHTQDLRKWLGTGAAHGGQPAYFPNAKLLVMRQEWSSAQGLLPPQADWYCPHGTEGVDPAKVVLLDSDAMLGEGVALVRTPGHTEGNHSLVAHTPEGLLVSSENGVSADSYAPLKSRIPGVRRFAEQTGMEVILNGNTLEGGLDQYISMVLEKEIAGPSPRNGDFYNFVPSSELSAYWGFPGLKPTFAFGTLEFGTPHLTHKVRAL